MWPLTLALAMGVAQHQATVLPPPIPTVSLSRSRAIGGALFEKSLVRT